MAMMQQACVNNGVNIGIEHDQIGIVPGRELAFAVRDSRQLRGCL